MSESHLKTLQSLLPAEGRLGLRIPRPRHRKYHLTTFSCSFRPVLSVQGLGPTTVNFVDKTRTRLTHLGKIKARLVQFHNRRLAHLSDKRL